jgi:hypothetical protein
MSHSAVLSVVACRLWSVARVYPPLTIFVRVICCDDNPTGVLILIPDSSCLLLLNIAIVIVFFTTMITIANYLII